MDLLVNKGGDPHAGCQENILLEVLEGWGHRRQVGALTERTGWRSRNRNELVDVIGLGSLPGGMPLGSAALFLLAGRPGGCWGEERVSAPLELAAMQGAQLRTQTLVFQFHFLALPPLLGQLLMEFFQLMFVVAFRAVDLLIAPKDPAGGQTFQIGAPLPVGAAEIRGQVGESGHAQSSGGRWSRRQLVSERRWRSWRTLR